MVIVELVALVCERVELASVTPFNETLFRFQEVLRVELVIVEFPEIPNATDEAMLGE